MIKKPQLFSDEPTGSLDDETADLVFKCITEISKKQYPFNYCDS